ncbi:MAG: 50S ribosome-binding GTPase [Lachnospiraceae bacterium]|nr:50S ribosome-binding GTPase [Lachnospiraceae bacterium]MCR4932658.1 guanylate kinase [Lachnospiraceae bacterium]
MGKIVYIMGKSSTGKDTIFKELIRKNAFNFKTIVSYTTRPIREGEKDGQEYFFTDEAGFNKLKDEGKVIEDRCYNTIHGPWRYFTVDDGQINDRDNYITIGTLESYVKICEYYGNNRIIPVLVELDDGVRLQRALNREKKQDKPKYEEMCRRFLADSADFSEEKIQSAKIKRRFYNNELNVCLQEIEDYIHENME